MGISFEYRANANKAKGAPIDLVFPKEGLGWDLEAFAIHKGTKNLAAAQKLADWASSKDAMLLYGKNFAITAQPGVAEPLENVPADYEKRLVKMDFTTRPRTASASWRSGPSATTPSPNRRSSRAAGPRGPVRIPPFPCTRRPHRCPSICACKASRRTSAPSRPCVTSTWSSNAASSSASSVPRDAARRRCCASSPASRPSRPAPSARPIATSRACRPPSATTASSSSRTRSSPT